MKNYNDKMIATDQARQKPMVAFHFSGAGSKLPPVIIKAESQEEAEGMWRAMAKAAEKPTIEQPKTSGI